MTLEHLSPETLALHGGTYRADPATGAVAVPIYQTTSFQFQDTATPTACLRWTRSATSIRGYRIRPRTPSRQRLAALEGGAAALLSSSGQAASAYSLLNLAQAGDNIVSLDRSLRRHLGAVCRRR